MFYYRFRSSSELSIKELMYNEIYFASTKECNDPFEGKAFLTFNSDKDKWKRLIELAWKNYDNTNKKMWKQHLSEYLVLMGSLTYDVVLGLDYAEILQSFNFPPNLNTANQFSNLFINHLNLYRPKDTYFASFSRENNNMLMWSHYASMHQGYCLIFKDVDNMLYQHPQNKKSSISRATPNGIFESFSYAIPKGFSFQDLSYSLNSTFKDSFYCFPQYVLGRNADEKEIEDILTWPSQQYLEKHDCWGYEKKSRLMLPAPSSWITGHRVECSQHERLLHYHPNQLVGIII